MELLIARFCEHLFAVVFKRLLKSFPIIFVARDSCPYILFLSSFIQSTPTVTRILYPYIATMSLAFGLFTLVMFIGVFLKIHT